MKEELSAFVDDELDDRAAGRVLDRLHADAGMRDEFELQMLIGDAIRGDVGHFGRGFSASVMAALDDEPTVLAPVGLRAQSSVRRLWMPAVAAVAGVALVSWIGFDSLSPTDTAPALAYAQPARAQVVVSADAPLRAYVVAHHGYSPAGSMQGVALYARGVADPQVDEGR